MIYCCCNCVAPKRHVGCHTDCEEYVGEKGVHDDREDLIRKQRALDTDIISGIIHSVRISQKMHGK